MAKTANPSTKKSGHVKLSLTKSDFAQLQSLAELDGKRVAVVVREIVLKYLAGRADDIAETNTANDIGGSYNENP